MPKIRLVQKEDLEALAALFSVSFTDADPERPWSYGQSLKHMEYWYTLHPDLFYVAEYDGELAGAMVTNIKPWREGNRCQDAILFVGTKYQKTGIGKKLFLKVIQESIEKYHTKNMEFITFAGTTFPKDWYARIGLNQDDGAIVIKGDCSTLVASLQEKV